MEASYNFNLSDRTFLSQQCLSKDLTHFFQICDYIKNLPYGRNSDRSDFSLVLKENKGTCSTKHAFLAQLARENNITNIGLYIGIYAMNAKNTKGIGDSLELNKLSYIPEAHTYLKFGDTIHDFTNKNARASTFKNFILFEERIQPKQIGNYKLELHQRFIRKWITDNAIPFSFDAIWRIREQCIVNLSQ